MQPARLYNLKPANTRAVAGQIAHEVIQYGLSAGWPDPIEELWIGDEIYTLSMVLNPLNIHHIDKLPGTWAFLLNSEPVFSPDRAGISDLILGQRYGIKHLLTILKTVLDQANLAYATTIVAGRLDDDWATDPVNFESWFASVSRQIEKDTSLADHQAKRLALSVLLRLAGEECGDSLSTADLADWVSPMPFMVVKARQQQERARLKWSIVYQDEPLKQTIPASFVIEANDKVEAAVAAFDFLLRNFNFNRRSSQGIPSLSGCEDLTPDEFEAAMARLPDFSDTALPVCRHILEIRPYRVRHAGRVVRTAED